MSNTIYEFMCSVPVYWWPIAWLACSLMAYPLLKTNDLLYKKQHGQPVVWTIGDRNSCLGGSLLGPIGLMLLLGCFLYMLFDITKEQADKPSSW